MTLMKSISGMRGTIGGQPGNALTPIDIVEFVSAYAQWLSATGRSPKVVVGRDGRITGATIQNLVISTLQLAGVHVVNLDLSTTPTVEMAVVYHKAGGGIILTASHNPIQWNALKFLNEKGEFISGEDGSWILDCISSRSFNYPSYDRLGNIEEDNGAIDRHIEEILNLPYVDAGQIASKSYKVVIDPINSTGAMAIPPLLDALGVEYVLINGEVTGQFAHNPEPVPKNLSQLSEAVVEHKADLGIAVDPDVDRLVLVNEDGSFFGEEYTLVAVADLILKTKSGPTVSNLSSSRALRDLSNKYDVEHRQSAVGEVHVVRMMKDLGAVIGGEGNGGIILPELHYGRDAMVGIALFLQLLSATNSTASELRASYPTYQMLKEKIELNHKDDADPILESMMSKMKDAGHPVNNTDGVKIDFSDGWVHLRKSNTEPIIRLYTEGESLEVCERLVNLIRKNL